MTFVDIDKYVIFKQKIGISSSIDKKLKYFD